MLLRGCNIMDMENVKVPVFEDGGLWQNPFVIGEGWRHFRVGTCTGAYRDAVQAFEILAISNDAPGNGHVEAALAHFFKSCKKHSKHLIIKEVINPGLRDKLCRLGFTCKIDNDYIKRF